jgi:hypothetical protein
MGSHSIMLGGGQGELSSYSILPFGSLAPEAVSYGTTSSSGIKDCFQFPRTQNSCFKERS